MIGDSAEPNRYFDPHFGVPTVKLLPGQYYVTEEPMAIVTVLGSCVAACIRDVTNGYGGMNHFMLPVMPGDLTGAIAQSVGMRYGSYAMELVVNELVKRGCKRENLEAKVFGGAAVVKAFTHMNIGEQNAEFVRNYLQADRIRIASEDLLGEVPRKIYFFPNTGAVHVKYLRELKNDTIAIREMQYMRRLAGEKIYGDVDIF